MKFRYYIYYKDFHYIFYDRKTKHIHKTTIDFHTLYIYLKKHKYNFDNIYIKSMSLHDFFRDYAYFEEEKEKL